MLDRPAHVPVRTCIGCRSRVPAAELLRVVVTPGPADQQSVPLIAEPDPRRRAAGRGAWVHPDPWCVADAVRRRAFGRALRVPAGLDPTPVAEFVSDATRLITQLTDPSGDSAP